MSVLYTGATPVKAAQTTPGPDGSPIKVTAGAGAAARKPGGEAGEEAGGDADGKAKKEAKKK